MTKIARLALACLVLMMWAGFIQAEEKEVAVPKVATPVIHLEEPTYRFDQVSQGEVVKHEFRVFNRGDAPLEIKKVKPG